MGVCFSNPVIVPECVLLLSIIVEAVKMVCIHKHDILPSAINIAMIGLK